MTRAWALAGLLLAALASGLAGCVDGGAPPTRWPRRFTVEVSPSAPEAVGWAADDLVLYLGAMGLEAERAEAEGEVSCRRGRGRVVLAGDGLGEAHLESPAPTDQTYRVDETRCGTGSLVVLSGGGLLGRQYAAYEWLHALGVRFFHPEQDFVPAAPDWPVEPVQREATPAFRFRSTSLHLTHPLELGDLFRLGDERYADEGVRYIDWQVKNLASYGTEGFGEGEHARRGIDRGFPRTAGLSLHGTQQGSRPLVDPDDPRSDEEQIAEGIAAAMDVPADERPEHLSFSFDPTEFTEVDDQDVVREMTFIAETMARDYPDVALMTTNHGTGGEPTPHYGVRYYDLPRFAPANLGVRVHSLMFYDLFRPAPVYGNESFQFLYDFMVDEYLTRRLWHFPEAAWWLTFDIAVPLYLPITIEARSRDIDGISFMLEGLLDGHRVFGTGHEWGYWQNEYCSFRMAADLDYDYHDCLRDITSPMGEAADEVEAVLEEVIALQERDIIYGDILAYLVGTDPETEVAASVGVVFHPLPPSPQEILRWDLDAVEDWNRRMGPALARMDDDYRRLVGRLEAVEELVPLRARPFFDEVLDGVEVTGLRARHGLEVYGAVVLFRESQLRFDRGRAEEAARRLTAAEATTRAALEVIGRREAGYRYRPLDRSIAGGPDGTEDDNWTIYHYRYLSRTHYAYYWSRIDELAADALAGSADAVAVDDALLGPDETLAVLLLDAELEEVAVAFGDGEEASGSGPFDHDYAAPGVYEVTVTAERGGEPYVYEARVAELTEERWTGLSARILEPAGAELIDPVLPGLVFGPIDEGRVAIGFGTDPSGRVAPGLWAEASRAIEPTALLETAPSRLVVPVVNRSTGAAMTSLVIERAVLRLEVEAGPVRLSGELSTEAVVEAIVAIGGFDLEGARNVVADLLGFTPDTLPEAVPFVAEFALPEE